MAAIKIKRSSVPTKVPATTDLELGELAVNTYDGKLYIKKNDGTDSIVQIGGGTGTGDVTLAGTQTLTNKTLTAPTISSPTISDGTAGGITYLNASKVLTSGSALTFDGTNLGVGTSSPTQKLEVAGVVKMTSYEEEVFAVTGTTPALSPTNGSIQTWTLTANSTPTAGTWAEGQSITLMVDDGTAYTITWTSLPVTWKTNGGTAPQLLASGPTPILLWKVGTVIYGARAGDA